MRGLSVNKKIVDYFYNKPKKISEEDFSMYSPHLTVLLKDFSRNFYGKEMERENLILAVKEIVKSYPMLSTAEVQYVLSCIVTGEYDIKKFAFNISDVIKCIKIYLSKKLSVQDAWYKAIKDSKTSEEGKQKEFTFLQDSLKKHQEKEHLTVYEKSALGKHFAKQMDAKNLETIMQITEEELPKIQKELNSRRSASMDAIFVDPEMNTPFMWTRDLLFGVKVYNSIQR